MADLHDVNLVQVAEPVLDGIRDFFGASVHRVKDDEDFHMCPFSLQDRVTSTRICSLFPHLIINLSTFFC